MNKPQHLVAAFFLAINTFLLFVALPVLFFAEDGHAQAPARPVRRRILVPPVGGAQIQRGPTRQAAEALQAALIDAVERTGLGDSVSAAVANRLPAGPYEPTNERCLRLARDVNATHVLKVRIVDHLRLDADVQAVNIEADLRDVAEGRLLWQGKSVRAFPREGACNLEARAEAAKLLALAFAEGAEFAPAYTPPELGQIVTPQPPPTPTVFPQMAYNGTGEPGDSIPDRADVRRQAIPPQSTFRRPEATDRPAHNAVPTPPAPTDQAAPPPAASTYPVATLPPLAAPAAPARAARLAPPPRPQVRGVPRSVPSPAESDCCPPETRRYDRARLLEVATFYFRSNSDRLEGPNRQALGPVAQALATYPGAEILIEGHTDARGDEEHNYRLSRDRAETVRQELLALGVPGPDRIRAYGMSEDDPAAEADTPEGHARNRRAVVFAVRPGADLHGSSQATVLASSLPTQDRAQAAPENPNRRRLQDILARIRRTRTGEAGGGGAGEDAELAAMGPGDDTVHPGDTLRIRVQGRDELTRTETVNKDGDLRFPLVDRLPVAGRRVGEVENDLTRALSKYVKDPQVEVSRVYRIKVFGLVSRQGVFQFDDAPSIPEVLAKAEGLAKEPANEQGAPQVMGHFLARVVRGGTQAAALDLSGYLKTGMGLGDAHLRDGDELIVEWNRHKPITLLGTVKTTVIYRPGLRLLEAISLAGGLEDETNQNVKNIRVLRQLEDGQTQRLEVNLHDLLHRGQVNRDIELMAGDYVVVPRRSKRLTFFTALRDLLSPVVQVGILKNFF